jgi:hypothetical protein
MTPPLLKKKPLHREIANQFNHTMKGEPMSRKTALTVAIAFLATAWIFSAL